MLPRSRGTTTPIQTWGYSRAPPPPRWRKRWVTLYSSVSVMTIFLSARRIFAYRKINKVHLIIIIFEKKISDMGNRKDVAFVIIRCGGGGKEEGKIRGPWNWRKLFSRFLVVCSLEEAAVLLETDKKRWRIVPSPNKKGILSLICGVEFSIFDKSIHHDIMYTVFAFSHPFWDKVFAF